MQHDKISNECRNKLIRIEKIIHLSTMCLYEDLPDIAEDAFGEDLEEVMDAMEMNEQELLNSSDTETGEFELWIVHELVVPRRPGFLIQASTPTPCGPVRSKHQSDYAHTWGSFTFKWFYADTIEEAIPKIIKWRDDYIEREIQ